MGADFIEKATPTFRRAWDRGRVRLATADLFTRTPDRVQRTVAGDILDSAQLQPGEPVTIEPDGQSLVARRGLTPVVRVAAPPPDVLRAVQRSCGVAAGRVEQVHNISGVAEISLW